MNARTGGCLCGQLRYRLIGAPGSAGLCFCADCRRASGSAGIAFMNYRRSAVELTGATRSHVSRSFRGSDAVRNFCAACGSLVFGGVLATSDELTIYAGSLDDASMFEPTIAIFGRDRPAWAALPPGVRVFDTLPEA